MLRGFTSKYYLHLYIISVFDCFGCVTRLNDGDTASDDSIVEENDRISTDILKTTAKGKRGSVFPCVCNMIVDLSCNADFKAFQKFGNS